MAGANESGVVIEVPDADALVGDWRAQHDPAAGSGVPAHITILYPFMPPGQLTHESLDALQVIAAGTAPFRFGLVAVDEFPGLLWLRPDPSSDLIALMRRVWAAYPRFPPYGGRYHEPSPHLTVAVVEPGDPQAAMRRELESSLSDQLPMDCTASALTILGSDARGRWTSRWRLEFGGS
jgi:2'-5' RNA ligase